MQKTKDKEVRKGSTLIEVLVALFVFSVMTLTFYEAFSLGLTRIIDAQKRLQAMGLATEQMEKIRNLGYGDVGFSGGVPACETHCALVPEETKTLGQAEFFVVTEILYKDDPLDGTLAAHTDAVPNDYKRVEVRVEWGDRSDSRRVSMVSRFVPPGMEQGLPNTGALSINIANYAAQPVENARVEITGITGSFFTDETGNIFLLGIPRNANGYMIRVTKTGYETLSTLAYPPTGAFPPKNAPVAVGNGTISVGNFELNPLTEVTIRARDPFGNAMSNVSFSLTGGRRWDNNFTTPQYECMNEAHTFNEEGEVILTQRSGGRYEFTLSSSSASTYVLWGTTLPSDTINAALFPYGGNATVDAVLIPKSVPGIAVTVKDANDAGIAGANVRVSGDVGYDEAQMTDSFGRAYFPKTAAGIVSGSTYTVHVSMDEYATSEETVTPTGFTEETITLNK